MGCKDLRPETTATNKASGFGFPEAIDPSNQYMFFLHGKVVEDQGIPAISPEYGEYEAILDTLSGFDFVVISEQRPKNTDAVEYARTITVQVTNLINAGVPAKNISVVGASKCAGITIYASHFLKNQELNFVILAICDTDGVEAFKQDNVFLSGNVLSIYDSNDKYAGSCQELFSFSEGKGVERYEEVVLNVGTGHGILYKPLHAWILPTVRWASTNSN